MCDILYTYDSLTDQGYTVIPVRQNKQPTVETWKVDNIIPRKYFKGAYGIALAMGGSKKLTAIDFDLKYDLTDTLFQRYKDQVNKDLLLKMRVHSTTTKGFHFLFSCDVVESNKVLAARHTTAEEHLATFTKQMSLGKSLVESCRTTVNDTKRVLIETRGEGGYVCIPPTPNYTHVYGNINKIKYSEYEELFTAAYELNEVFVSADKGYGSTDTADNYNKSNRGLDLLLKYGWAVVREGDKNVRLKRPGDSSSKDSAIWDKETNIFWVFSTSSCFTPNTAYRPFDILTQLEYNGNYRKALKEIE